MGNRAILAVDAGGTSIKYSLVSNDTLDQLTEEHFFNMPSSGTKEELMGTFAAVLEGAMEQSRKIDCTIASTAFSVPGPFDCKNGIIQQFLPLIWKYTNVQELTPHILNELIEKIVVHEKEIGEDGVKTQQVDIYYKFIGCVNIRRAKADHAEIIKAEQGQADHQSA